MTVQSGKTTRPKYEIRTLNTSTNPINSPKPKQRSRIKTVVKKRDLIPTTSMKKAHNDFSHHLPHGDPRL